MNIERFKDRLITRRQKLLDDLRDIEQSLDAPMPKDFEDRASERQGDEVLETLGSVEEHELKRIDAALSRIKDGSYGICVKCGNRISEERLVAVPETPFCQACMSLAH